MSTSSSSRHILVTGGAGYIGSHTTIDLLKAGYQVTIVDNLINSNIKSLERISELTGKKPAFYQVDLRNKKELEQVFKKNQFDACIHFAGLKAVGESVSSPLMYYDHNIVGALNLFECLIKYNCKRVVFSSSATVYALAKTNPIPETESLGTTNPYGRTKLHIENMLQDLAAAPVKAGEQAWKIIILRYFNPIGAHESGIIGEDPNGIPNNLLPFVMQVAVGKRQAVNVFGNDYPTPDGTGVRDYIHVCDLSLGHLAALEHGIFGPVLASAPLDVFNLGTGVGYSVLDVIKAAEVACGKPVPYVVAARRTGDIATCFAEADKAKRLLHWTAKKSLQDGVNDSWRWQSKNPDGFATKKD